MSDQISRVSGVHQESNIAQGGDDTVSSEVVKLGPFEISKRKSKTSPSPTAHSTPKLPTAPTLPSELDPYLPSVFDSPEPSDLSTLHPEAGENTVEFRTPSHSSTPLASVDPITAETSFTPSDPVSCSTKPLFSPISDTNLTHSSSITPESLGKRLYPASEQLQDLNNQLDKITSDPQDPQTFHTTGTDTLLVYSCLHPIHHEKILYLLK